MTPPFTIQPETEYRFHPKRRWRFDFAWPDHGGVALEVQGGGWTNGRHSRASGMAKDYEKLAAAILLGWTVFYCTPQQLKAGIPQEWIDRWIKGHTSPAAKIRMSALEAVNKAYDAAFRASVTI